MDTKEHNQLKSTGKRDELLSGKKTEISRMGYAIWVDTLYSRVFNTERLY